MPVGICKFCRQEKKLSQSHIIPQCLYHLNKRGQMILIDIWNKRKDGKHYQNGFKEPLLCYDCDNALGKLDRYAKKILFDAIHQHNYIMTTEVGGVISIKDFDYDKLRKFFISLAWRISISTAHFSLGKYEEVALGILKNEIQDDRKLFLPIIIRRNTGTVVDNMTGILPNKFNQHEACRVRFPGYEIVIVVRPDYTNNIIDGYSKLFTKHELIIMEMNSITQADVQIIKGINSCRK